MDNKTIIRSALIILVAIAIYFYKKIEKKKEDKVAEIIERHSQRKVTNTKVVKDPKIDSEQIEFMNEFLKLLVPNHKYDQVLSIIRNRKISDYDRQNWTIANELINQELINRNYSEKLFLYGHFDWKFPSTEMKYFLENALKENFNIEKKFDHLDLAENNLIHESFPIFEEEFAKLNLKLRNIDVGSDSYTIVIIKDQDFERAEYLIDKMNLKLQRIG